MKNEEIPDAEGWSPPDVEDWGESFNKELIDAVFGELMEAKPEVAKDFIRLMNEARMRYLEGKERTIDGGQ